MKKLLILLALMGSLLPFQPVEAHTKCKVNLGFGNWTEGCPGHAHPRKPVYTKAPKNYRFTVYNSSPIYTISYYYSSTKYVLRPGQKRRHSVSRTSPIFTFVMDKWAGDGRYTKHYYRVNVKTHDLALTRDRSSRIIQPYRIRK